MAVPFAMEMTMAQWPRWTGGSEFQTSARRALGCQLKCVAVRDWDPGGRIQWRADAVQAAELWAVAYSEGMRSWSRQSHTDEEIAPNGEALAGEPSMDAGFHRAPSGEVTEAGPGRLL